MPTLPSLLLGVNGTLHLLLLIRRHHADALLHGSDRTAAARKQGLHWARCFLGHLVLNLLLGLRKRVEDIADMTRNCTAKLLCRQPSPAPSWHHPYHPSCLPSLRRETLGGRFAKRWSENPNGWAKPQCSRVFPNCTLLLESKARGRDLRRAPESVA